MHLNTKERKTTHVSYLNTAVISSCFHGVSALVASADTGYGEFLIMRPLECKTIPDNVIATQNALGLRVAVGLFQPFPLEFGNSGSDESENYCNIL